MRFKLEKNALSDMLDQDSTQKRSTNLLLSSKSRKKQAKNEIEFNSSGQVIRDKLMILQERPHYRIYPIEEEEYEICVFCRCASNDEELRVKCGPVYGPIKIKQAGVSGNAFVHELCALWTPEIFLDEKNKFRNLGKGIKRCGKIKCSICREKGGGLGCFIKDCHKSYHY